MKTIKKILLALTLFFGSTIICNAATLNVNEYLSSSNIAVGDTVTVTVKLSSSSPIGAINYSVTYDSDKLTHTSGTLNNIIYATDESTTSTTLTFKFKAKANGNANINFKINEAFDFSEVKYSYSDVSKTVTIKTNEQVKASYSSDNTLSKLGVEGYTITPAFNKNTTEYSLEVENEITSIKVTGTKNHNKASVNGLGDHGLDEGLNKIEIKVTAQNGSSKTYVINVTRKELAPIVVTLNGSDFTVVRKSELLTEPNSTFEASSTTIGEEEVPSLVNSKLGITLLGLKDNEGNISLYKYENEQYTKYHEIKSSNIIVIPNEIDIDLPTYYVEKEVEINGTKYLAYTRDDIFYIFGATNIETGESGIYQYDTKDKVVQIYNDKDAKELLQTALVTQKRINKRNYLIIALASFLVVTYIGILVKIINKPKKVKVTEYKENKKSKKNEIEEEE